MGEILHEQVQHAAAGTHLPIPCAVIDPWNAGVEDGPGAHGTGLQRHIEGAVVQPPGAKDLVGLPDGIHLGVRGGVLLLLPAVAAPAHDPALPDDDTAHRHLAVGGGLLGQCQRLTHIFLVHGAPPENFGLSHG